MMHGGRPPMPPSLAKSPWRVPIDKASKWLGAGKDCHWLEEMRGNLAMAATVIATMTFQVGLNPPGGVVQSWGNAIVDCTTDNEAVGKHIQGCPGQSVFGTVIFNHYGKWLLFNNISFFSSLIVCLWLISGLPLNHRFPVWLMATSMCISLTGLSLTYLYGVDMILPFYVWEQFKSITLYTKIIWFIVVGIVVFISVLRFLLLFVAFLPDESSNNKSSAKSPRDELD